MHATPDSADLDLLRALLPLVPPTILRAVLDEIGFGSVPRTRLLEEALLAVLQAAPGLRERLLAQVHVTLDQAAALLQTTQPQLAPLIKADPLPGNLSSSTSPRHPVIAAAELVKHRARMPRDVMAQPDHAVVRLPDASGGTRYDPITRAFLAGLGEAERVPLTPDPFQHAAVSAVVDTDVVVIAPSGSGKTWIAERAISRALANGQTVCYTTPLKALSNQKFRRFRTLFGYHSVGLLTGERRENTRAPVVVATTEILRNQLYGHGSFPDLIILDEAHYLADPERGSAWEEVIALAPPTSVLLLLSATISNAEVVANWMASVRPRPPELVTAEVRPVPLRYGLLHEHGAVLPVGLAPYLLPHAPFQPLQVSRLLRLFHTLRGQKLLPAIVFWPTRRACDEAAAAFRELDLPGARERAVAYDQLAREYPLLRTHPLRHTLISAGVAPHHAGHLLAWRIVVEEFLRDGLLSIVFATTTLAAGLDVPVRTVVLPSLTVWDTDGPRAMRALEFHQMVGRAGRRGKDRVGFVLFLPEDQETLTTARTLMTSASEPLHSAFHVTYGQILALLGRFETREAQAFWHKTFAAYEHRATVIGLQRQLEALPDDPLEGRPCEDRLPTRTRYDALQSHLAELRHSERPQVPGSLLRPGRVVTLRNNQVAVLLRHIALPGSQHQPWECLTLAGERRISQASDIVNVSACLLDMGHLRPVDHLVTPLFAAKQLQSAGEVPESPSPLTLEVGAVVRLRQSGRVAVVHRLWRRGHVSVAEVLRDDGRVETCRLGQIEARYELNLRHPLLPLAADVSLLLGQRVVIAGRRPNRGILLSVEGTRLRGRAVIQLEDGKQITCALHRVRLIRTYHQGAFEVLSSQLRDVARTPAPLLYEAQGSYERARITARLQELPCPRCALQAACETSLGSLQTLTRHRGELVRTIATLQAKVTGEFERRMRLLQHLGYISAQGQLTANGRWAREIRHPHELVVCELLRRQLALAAKPEAFAALLAALTTERPPRRLVGHPPLLGLPDLLRELQRLEQQHGIPSPQLSAILAPVPQRWLTPEEEEEGESRAAQAPLHGGLLPSAGERRAACLYRWATGTPWQQLVSWAEIDEGDLERLILQTAELLQQIEHLLLPGYGALAHAARQAILRPPVA